MGYKLIGNNKLIPRLDYQGRKREYVKTSSDSPFENVGTEISVTPFVVEKCSVQPMTGRAVKDYSLRLSTEGYRDHDSFMVYSSVRLTDSHEGTGILPDQIFLPDSNGIERWFTVIKTDRYVSSGVDRFQSYVVAMPEV